MPDDMRRLVASRLAVASCLAVIVTGAPDAGAKERPRACDYGSKGQQLFKSSRVVILRFVESGRDAYVLCERDSNRETQLNHPSYQSIGDFQIRGRFAAFSLFSTDRQGVSEGVVVLNVNRPRRPRGFPAYANSDELPDGHYHGVTSLELTRGGSVAWISRRPGTDPFYEVRYALAGAPDETLDSSPDIIESSLALGKRFIYWQRTDGPRFAAR